jgi:hypothetical protein
MRGTRRLALTLALTWMVPRLVGATVIPVAPTASIQDAIDQACAGDVIQLEAGTYVEDLDFGGQAVTVVGLGPATVLQGTGTGPVVVFASGEGPDSVLDSVVVTGGVAERGGGVYIQNASPTVLRNVIFHNRARREGSGIYLNTSNAVISNNLLIYNRTALGDPHGIQIVNAAPTIVNNTFVRGDSNGLLLSGNSPARIANNMFVRNGSRGRGRGICDFSGGVAEIHYNLFYRNRKAALLTNGQDFRGIGRADRAIGPPRLLDNVDGNPRFAMRHPPRLDSRKFERTTIAELVAGLRPRLDGRRKPAVDAGDPDPGLDDLDGSRNDIGFTGGPNAPTW